MFGFNTGIAGGLTTCVSSMWDRFVSTVQTIIDTVKAKLVELWKGNPVVAAVMSVFAVVIGIAVVMFFPAVVSAVKAIGSGLIRIFTSLVSVIINLINGLIGRLGRAVSRKAQ